MLATIFNKACPCSSQQVLENQNSLPRLTQPVRSALMTVFGWGPVSWSCRQAAVPLFFLHVLNVFHTAAVFSLSGDKGSSSYDENSSAAWVSCFSLTPGSVTLLKTQTALSPHGDILMAANHTSISSYMSPSNRLGDGKGWGGGWGGEGEEACLLLCTCVCFFVCVFVHVRENRASLGRFFIPEPFTPGSHNRAFHLPLHSSWIHTATKSRKA